MPPKQKPSKKRTHQWVKKSVQKKYVICQECNATSVHELGTPRGAAAWRAHIAADRHAKTAGYY